MSASSAIFPRCKVRTTTLLVIVIAGTECMSAAGGTTVWGKQFLVNVHVGVVSFGNCAKRDANECW